MGDELFPVKITAKDKNGNKVSISLFSNVKNKIWLKIQWPTDDFGESFLYIEENDNTLKGTLVSVFKALDNCGSKRRFKDMLWIWMEVSKFVNLEFQVKLFGYIDTSTQKECGSWTLLMLNVIQ